MFSPLPLLLQSLLISLALTLVLELAFALAWGVRKEGLLLVVLMNVFTNPAVVTLHFLCTVRLEWPALPVTAALEAAAITAEGFCAKGMIRRPWRFAILVNLFSYGAGALLHLIVS